MVISHKNMTNLLEVKTVENNRNKKMMTGLIQGYYKGYQKREGKFYLVTCTET